MAEWDQIEGEPDDWFNRFERYYLPQGPERTFEQAWRLWRDSEAKTSRAKRPNPSWYHAKQKYNWEGRAQAWDALERRKRQKVEDEARSKMLDRHVQAALTIYSAAMNRFVALAKDKLQMEGLDIKDALALLKYSVELERLTRGFPKEILEVWALDNEELVIRYQNLIARLEGASGSGSGDEAPGDSSAEAPIDDNPAVP